MNMAPETKLTAGFAVLGWLVTAAATVSMIGGNQTAINGVIGAGVPALAFTTLAILTQRWESQRHH
ncbi:hypothetical protein ABZ352_35695 [Streptomyces griseofuscus]|uniref:hypothetical protein n=1 Tax=Streptomyces griseofuscus TaxID=146922 RepID=UPI003410674C